MRGIWEKGIFLIFPHEKRFSSGFSKGGFWGHFRPFPHSRFGHFQCPKRKPLFNRNIPLISGKYGLRNHFWPLKSVFLTRKSKKKGPNQRLQPAQNFWVIFVLYSRLLADFLSHLEKWVKLIKFEAKIEFFLHLEGWKPQSTTSTP